MIAEILNTFPSFSYDYVMKGMTFKQFLLWHMQAMRIKYDIEVELNCKINVDKELEDINNKFVWNEKTKRYE